MVVDRGVLNIDGVEEFGPCQGHNLGTFNLVKYELYLSFIPQGVTSGSHRLTAQGQLLGLSKGSQARFQHQWLL